MNEESVLERKLLSIVIFDQIEGLHILWEIITQKAVDKPSQIMIKAKVNLRNCMPFM